ncbi:glycine-rich extracellular protein 1 isoform X2 [Dendropsophus ebraccatus]|uniref:glycine-rich extracellular protein 1 isoform X2 n=1 Tax=Dendropsophus ebraccatus TaxID=150705 RepID=UPI00383166FD
MLPPRCLPDPACLLAPLPSDSDSSWGSAQSEDWDCSRASTPNSVGVGVKPQHGAAASPVYQPEYLRGAGSQQQGALGPLGAKAGGLQNAFGGLGQKSRKLGLGQFSSKQKPGYGNGNYLGNVLAQGYGAGGYPNTGGYGGKFPKSGYGAGNYPQFGAQTGYGAGNFPQYGEQAGYGAGSYPQYGGQAGYQNGAGLYPSNGAGLYPSNGAGLYPSNGAGLYPSNGAGLYQSNLQQQGYGAKPSKAGYGAGGYPNAAQGGYRNGYGGYPSNFQQQGKSGKQLKSGYGNGAGMFPSAAGLQGGIGKPSKAAAGYPSSFFPQGLGAKSAKARTDNRGLYQQPYPNGFSNVQGNGKGIKSPLGAYQGPAGESSKLGGLGKLPYRSQPVATDSLGLDTKSAKSAGVKSPYGSQSAYPDPASSKYAGAGQIPFSSQPVSPSGMEEDVTPSSPVDGGYQQLGGAQSAWTYAPEESSYGQAGYYGNGYRGCSGKC